jgi:SAM-dependent methyltransferase
MRQMICRICDGTKLEKVLDLGNQPWCNHFLKPEEVGTEPTYPLRVVYCHYCSTTQLGYTVKKEIMFGDHTYLSGVTKSLSSHFKSVADEIDAIFPNKNRKKTVLDIGSNDGTQLKHFQALGYEVLGVESSKTTAKIAMDDNVPTLNAFFILETAKKLVKNLMSSTLLGFSSISKNSTLSLKAFANHSNSMEPSWSNFFT